MGVFRTRDERSVERGRRAAPEDVTPGMRIAAAWSWRILVVAAVIALVGFLIIQVKLIAVPFFIAVILAALLVPLKNFLRRHRWPGWLAVAVCEIGTIAVVVALITLVTLQVRSGYANIKKETLDRYQDLTQWLHGAPFYFSDSQISGYLSDLWKGIQNDSSGLFKGALDIGSTAAHVLTGVLLVLFSTLFLLIDGRGIFLWFVGLFPRRARPAVTGAGESGWTTLTRFVRVQVFVAAVDAVGIGVGALILGLFTGGFPLLIPIAVLVFLGSFIPVVGAVITGVVAVFVALVYLGPLPAVIMLGIVLFVHLLEGHVLQPFVMGTAVRVHPLAVVLGVAGFGFAGGIAGAFFAVPLIAVLNVMIGYVARGEWRTDPRLTEKDAVST